MVKWFELCRKALNVYLHRDEYTYCLGCAGEVVGQSSELEARYKYYYQTPEYHDMMKPWHMWANENWGKKAMDCSGFIQYITGKEMTHNLSSWSYGEMKPKSTPVDGVAGSVLWKKGHVGIDIAFGFFLHFPNWNRSCELGRIREYDWVSSHHIDGIDYTGSYNV